MVSRGIVVAIALVLSLTACSSGGEDAAPDTTAPPPTTSPPTTQTTEVATTSPPTTAPTTTTTTTTTLPPRIAFPGDVTEVLDSESFGASHAMAGPIVEHEGLLHMFYVAAESQGSDYRIARATSDDGAIWTQEEDWLFTPEDVPYGGPFLAPGSALVTADGTWLIYFHSQNGMMGTRNAVIGRAVATDPGGPWSVDPEPVLAPGESGSWDASGVGYPMVIADDSGYRKWYDGHSRDQDLAPDRSIGLATSDDGIVWTRYDDPATTEAPFAASDPVLRMGEPGAWDELRVFDANVVASDDGYAMVYVTQQTAGGNRSNTGFGIATSDDGITWVKSDDGAFLWLIDPESKEMIVPGLIFSANATLTHRDGAYQLYFDLVFPGKGATYMLQHEGSIAEPM